VGDNCSLENGTVIGPDVKIENDVTVHSNVRIWPKISISAGSKVKEDMLGE
jgi:mannose-1-phosphate guanylyltransferase